MGQRYTFPVATRVAGAVASPGDENDVDLRVVQNSADINSLGEAVATVGAAAFTPASSADSAKLGYAGMGVGCTTFPATATLQAPIQLPHGSQVDELLVDGDLVDAGASVQVDIVKGDLSSGGVTTIATVSRTGTAGRFSVSVAFSAETIDNSSFVYFLTATLISSAGGAGVLTAAKVQG